MPRSTSDLKSWELRFFQKVQSSSPSEEPPAGSTSHPASAHAFTKEEHDQILRKLPDLAPLKGHRHQLIRAIKESNKALVTAAEGAEPPITLIVYDDIRSAPSDKSPKQY
jgi:hypothetical protein